MNADILVGGVSVAFGVVLLSAATFNWDWCFELRKSRWIESLCGRTGARVFFAILGFGLIILGAAIVSGFGPNKSGGAAGQSRAKPSGPTLAILSAGF